MLGKMWGKHKWSKYSGKTIDGSFYMVVALFLSILIIVIVFH